jgi:hypothetical protein
MRSRIAYAAVLFTGLALIAVALQGLRGMDSDLKVAAAREAPSQVIEPASWDHRGPCHRGDHRPGSVV